MKHQAFSRMAAVVLSLAALAGGSALAQTAAHRTTDVAPPPAEDRSSVGAVVLMDEPVLARREQMARTALRSGVDTRSMGAGPAPANRRAATKLEIEAQRAREAAELQRRGAAGQTEE